MEVNRQASGKNRISAPVENKANLIGDDCRIVDFKVESFQNPYMKIDSNGFIYYLCSGWHNYLIYVMDDRGNHIKTIPDKCKAEFEIISEEIEQGHLDSLLRDFRLGLEYASHSSQLLYKVIRNEIYCYCTSDGELISKWTVEEVKGDNRITSICIAPNGMLYVLTKYGVVVVYG